MAKAKTDLEGMLRAGLKGAGLYDGCTEQVKAIDGRRFAWDFCWADEPYRLLAEVQGSVWVKGGHNTGTGLNRDYTKLNLATIAGWHIMFFSGDMIKDGTAIIQLEAYFEAKRARSQAKG